MPGSNLDRLNTSRSINEKRLIRLNTNSYVWPINRVSLRETAKSEKAKMADQYETYIDGNYSRRDNYWQNSKFFGGL